jgi:hypothetical protein
MLLTGGPSQGPSACAQRRTFVTLQLCIKAFRRKSHLRFNQHADTAETHMSIVCVRRTLLWKLLWKCITVYMVQNIRAFSMCAVHLIVHVAECPHKCSGDHAYSSDVCNKSFRGKPSFLSKRIYLVENIYTIASCVRNHSNIRLLWISVGLFTVEDVHKLQSV